MKQWGVGIIENEVADDTIQTIIYQILRFDINDGHWRDRADDLKEALDSVSTQATIKMFLDAGDATTLSDRVMTAAKLFMFAGVKLPMYLVAMANVASFYHGMNGEQWGELWEDRKLVLRKFFQDFHSYDGTPVPITDDISSLVKVRDLMEQSRGAKTFGQVVYAPVQMTSEESTYAAKRDAIEDAVFDAASKLVEPEDTKCIVAHMTLLHPDGTEYRVKHQFTPSATLDLVIFELSDNNYSCDCRRLSMIRKAYPAANVQAPDLTHSCSDLLICTAVDFEFIREGEQ